MKWYSEGPGFEFRSGCLFFSPCDNDILEVTSQHKDLRLQDHNKLATKRTSRSGLSLRDKLTQNNRPDCTNYL
jgi:hypothetical protein